MSSGPDPSSFTARRSAASNLPNFQLPPPELSNMQKYPPFAAINFSQTSSVSTGSLLTPPTNMPGDGLSPISSSIHSGSSSSNPGGPPFTPAGYWAPPSSTASPYGYGALSAAPQNQYASQNMGGRNHMFSPSLGSLGRHSSNSPTNGGGGGDGLSLPPPPYDLSLPPFPPSMTMSAPGGSGLPNLATQQQQQQQQQAMASVMMHNGSNVQTPPISVPEAYHHQPQKLPPTPSYYSSSAGGGGSHPSSAPAQQTSFSNTYGVSGSPGQQSPSSAASASRFSPLSHTHNSGQPPHLQPASAQPPPSSSNHYQQRSFSYQLPAMGGPIMSNMHSPGGHLSLIGGGGGMAGHNGGMMSAYGNHGGMSNMYPHHAQQHQQHQQQQQAQDRPFRCDVCPQSFNRNHDLKRHKRIHLAVKPFPCGFCDKSFSRKDALKRHILVKGCGTSRSSMDSTTKQQEQQPHQQNGSTSPLDKSSDPMSSDDDEEDGDRGADGEEEDDHSPVMINGHGHGVKMEMR